METVFFQETPCHTYGTLPTVGTKAPDFHVVNADLQTVSLADYAGKRLVLNVFPSLDTPVCAMSVRRFNSEASKLDNVKILCVSMDLPFAQKRFCTAEGIDNLEVASAFRSADFVQNYGLKLVDGPLEGLLARAVLIVDENGNVIFRDLVDEITHEPDYEAALSVLK